MRMNGKVLGLFLTFIAANSLQASTFTAYQKDYLTVASMTVKAITKDVLNQEQSRIILKRNFGDYDYYSKVIGLPDAYGQLDPSDKFGKVIQSARDLVALGEDVYNLVIKGKPSNTTSYAPISVIPSLEGKAVDILDTEGWSDPNKVTYEIIYKNLYGMEVVKFRYSIIWSFGGSYNLKGHYITAAQIVPESVNTLFGYDFTATMKLGGIQNNGSKANPVAAATLLLEYTVRNILRANLNTASHFITGTGNYKQL